MTVLDSAEVAAALADLTGWTGDTAALLRTHACSSFPAAISAVDRIAVIAEDMDHHPDIDIRWRTLTFTLSTHSEGGVTAADIELARRIEEVLAEA